MEYVYPYGYPKELVNSALFAGTKAAHALLLSFVLLKFLNHVPAEVIGLVIVECCIAVPLMLVK
jgi:hypothetical protein